MGNTIGKQNQEEEEEEEDYSVDGDTITSQQTPKDVIDAHSRGDDFETDGQRETKRRRIDYNDVSGGGTDAITELKIAIPFNGRQFKGTLYPHNSIEESSGKDGNAENTENQRNQTSEEEIFPEISVDNESVGLTSALIKLTDILQQKQKAEKIRNEQENPRKVQHGQRKHPEFSLNIRENPRNIYEDPFNIRENPHNMYEYPRNVSKKSRNMRQTLLNLIERQRELEKNPLNLDEIQRKDKRKKARYKKETSSEVKRENDTSSSLRLTLATKNGKHKKESKPIFDFDRRASIIKDTVEFKDSRHTPGPSASAFEDQKTLHRTVSENNPNIIPDTVISRYGNENTDNVNDTHVNNGDSKVLEVSDGSEDELDFIVAQLSNRVEDSCLPVS